MELIERYLQEIGRHLPANKRADILSELRSALGDSLESRGGAAAGEEDVVRVIKEMGAPRKVAASYYPEGQYLIGPELFAFFQLVLGIVLAASVGGQLIAIAVPFVFSHQSGPLLQQFAQILGSIPASFGAVVFVFAVLQRLNVRPEFEQEEFDPRALPVLERDQPIKRSEQVVSIIFATLFLTFLSAFVADGGFHIRGGVGIFKDLLIANPVLEKYFMWIAISILIGILLDIVLLWRGRWETSTRIAKIAAAVFGLVVLYLLTEGHAAWLSQMGVKSFFVAASQSANTPQGFQVLVMSGFHMAFLVAFIVTTFETLLSLYRLLRSALGGGALPGQSLTPDVR